jgi:hypothetical protein
MNGKEAPVASYSSRATWAQFHFTRLLIFFSTLELIPAYSYRGHHARRTYQHIYIIAYSLLDLMKWNSGMYVMPDGRNTDAALHRDTYSYIWAYEH